MSSLIQAILTQAYVATALSHASENFPIHKWRQSMKNNVGFFSSPHTLQEKKKGGCGVVGGNDISVLESFQKRTGKIIEVSEKN